MKPKALLIVNPFSGNKKGEKVAKEIEQKILPYYKTEFFITTGVGSAGQQVKKRLNEIEAVIVIGGDGTVNDVLQEIVGSKITMGVFPLGSGNATAREMGVKNISVGIEKIIAGKFKTIDCALLNGKYFINLAGIGFDSLVAKEFHSRNQRGLLGYLFLCAKHYFSFIPLQLTFSTKDTSWLESVFMVNFANVRQMGNNAIVAPLALPDDGKLDLCIIRPFPVLLLPKLGYQLFTGKLRENKYIHYQPFENLKIEGDFEYAQMDGEPIKVDGKVEISVIPNGIKVFA